jgi:hypothetical protein
VLKWKAYTNIYWISARIGGIIVSVVDLDKVDAAGKDNNENALRLMITDHLDWEYEDIHLEILQDKINVYLQYIENKQYVEKHGDGFEKFYIDIYFKEKIIEKCVDFLRVVTNQLQAEKIFINMHFE